MNRICKYFVIILLTITLLDSCKTIEKASTHGFDDGYYMVKTENKSEKVYIDISDEKVTVYDIYRGYEISNEIIQFPHFTSDSTVYSPFKFNRTSLDIDLSSILLKYRPNKDPLPSELTSDFNLAIYAGPRFDHFSLRNTTDPLGNRHYKVSSWGFDFGLLAGIGATTIGSFNTQGAIQNEYNGMFFQTGLASFLESHFASFGLAVGYDFLTGPDRGKWIYQNKPWIGFVIGIALN